MKYLIPAVVAIGVFALVRGNRMILSQKGLALIKVGEGLSLDVYTDEAGYKTIGFGHKLKEDENFTFITVEQAVQLLKQDVRFAQDAVNEFIKVPLTQDEFDALVSFTFNVGANALRKSTLASALNALDQSNAQGFAEAKQAVLQHELPRWNKVTKNGEKVVSAGLRRRRALEMEVAAGEMPTEIVGLV